MNTATAIGDDLVVGARSSKDHTAYIYAKDGKRSKFVDFCDAHGPSGHGGGIDYVETVETAVLGEHPRESLSGKGNADPEVHPNVPNETNH